MNVSALETHLYGYDGVVKQQSLFAARCLQCVIKQEIWKWGKVDHLVQAAPCWCTWPEHILYFQIMLLTTQPLEPRNMPRNYRRRTDQGSWDPRSILEAVASFEIEKYLNAAKQYESNANKMFWLHSLRAFEKCRYSDLGGLISFWLNGQSGPIVVHFFSWKLFFLVHSAPRFFFIRNMSRFIHGQIPSLVT